jgi:hypothetical protein
MEMVDKILKLARLAPLDINIKSFDVVYDSVFAIDCLPGNIDGNRN